MAKEKRKVLHTYKRRTKKGGPFVTIKVYKKRKKRKKGKKPGPKAGARKLSALVSRYECLKDEMKRLRKKIESELS